ncbi:MAG: cupin domain-containing protein [Dehalococcoidia bacterium]|nr:cupin domain-containing protein [Dehalococcoidia bacterium]
MAEREANRAREVEASPPGVYEFEATLRKRRRELAENGKIVIRGSETPFQQGRQSRSKYFLHASAADAALQGWLVFMQDIRTNSGRHRHQGGLAIYVVEGKGWTVVDGVRYDWVEGDLILLPVKPGGVEHQHFNAEPGKSCKWLAMIYDHFVVATCSGLEQSEASPDWKGHA